MNQFLSIRWQLAVIVVLGMVLSACGSMSQIPQSQREPHNVVSPTSQGDTSDHSDNDETDTEPIGDVEQGEQLLTQSVGSMPSCSTCHAISTTQIVVPGLAGIGERAATRVEGQTASEYLHKSIIDPGEFVVEGFQNVMPDVFEQQLSTAQIRDLVAYLLSL